MRKLRSWLEPMPHEEGRERHSKALPPILITDSDERARKEAQNDLIQSDLVYRMIDQGLDPERQPFRLRSSIIMHLHFATLERLDYFAGTYRPEPIDIGKSKHVSPDDFLVDELVHNLCDYVNEHWTEKTSIHLGAYVLWKINSIHPFTDGNGRTGRAVSYIILCAHAG
jgi:Fic family protein